MNFMVIRVHLSGLDHGQAIRQPSRQTAFRNTFSSMIKLSNISPKNENITLNFIQTLFTFFNAMLIFSFIEKKKKKEINILHLLFQFLK